MLNFKHLIQILTILLQEVIIIELKLLMHHYGLSIYYLNN